MKRTTKRDLTIEYTAFGDIRISTVRGNDRISVLYSGYTKRNAVVLFLKFVNNIN